VSDADEMSQRSQSVVRALQRALFLPTTARPITGETVHRQPLLNLSRTKPDGTGYAQTLTSVVKALERLWSIASVSVQRFPRKCVSVCVDAAV